MRTGSRCCRGGRVPKEEEEFGVSAVAAAPWEEPFGELPEERDARRDAKF